MLKEKRKEYRLTQEELAEKVLVSPKTISNWENGKTTPDLESLIILAKLFNMSLDKLLLEGSDIVTEMNNDLKKGRNILKFITVSVIVTVFISLVTFLVYEQSTNRYREQYEEHIREKYIFE